MGFSRRGGVAAPVGFRRKGSGGAAAETFAEHMATYSWDVYYDFQDTGFPIDNKLGNTAGDMAEDTSQAAGSPTFEATGALPGLANAVDWVEPDNPGANLGLVLPGVDDTNMDANGITMVVFCRARTDGQNGGYPIGATGFATIMSFKSDGDFQVRVECNSTNAELLTTVGPFTAHYTNDDDIMVAAVGDTSYNLRLWKGHSGTLTELTAGATQGVSGYNNNYGSTSRIWSLGGLVGQPRSMDGLMYWAGISAQFQASTAQLQAMLDKSGF